MKACEVDEEAKAPPANSAEALELTKTPKHNIPASKEINHVYLDFSTTIATVPVFETAAHDDYPRPPDLRKYENPYDWSRRRKLIVTWVSCVTNGGAAYASGSYASPADQLTQKWQISQVTYYLGIALFTYGFGLAPMFLAPMSEISGRRPVFVLSGMFFVLMELGCALTPSFGGMLAFRLLAGMGGSTFSTMVGGILADIWEASERNTPMVLFTGATLFGTGLGPLVSGLAAQRLAWQWTFYLQVILTGVLVFVVVLVFEETRGPILLARKAKKLNEYYGELERLGAVGMQIPDNGSGLPAPRVMRIRYRVLAEEQRATILEMIKISLTRPAYLLFTEPVVITFAAWISFSWAILYLQFGAIPLVYRTVYDFSLEQTGLVFIAVCIGAIIGTGLSIYQDKWAIKRFGARFSATPEGRLYFTCAEGLLLPIGLFWFGWTIFEHVHWVVSCIGIVLLTLGIFSIFLATFNYTADVYQTYASSALAAQGICRNLLGGTFPLVTVQMFDNLGFHAASSMLGGIAILLALGPGLLIWFGPTMRLKSGVARQFIKEQQS